MRLSTCVLIAAASIAAMAVIRVEAQVERHELPSPEAVAPRRPSSPPPPSGAWITDEAARCRVWNPSPDPGDSVRWQGACPGGIAQGPGMLQWFADGQPTDRYEGELRNGRPEGRGTWHLISGDSYSGELKNGDYNGHGVVSYANGDRYEGMFKDGEYDGPGTMTYDDGGLRVDGIYRNGELIALTVATLRDGSRYQGQFPFGRGVLVRPDGTRLEGWFNDLRLQRRGIATYPNGERYEGSFRDGVENGSGVLKLPSGATYTGEFYRGKPEGKGSLKEADGTSVSGEWRDGCWTDGTVWRAVRTTAETCGFK